MIKRIISFIILIILSFVTLTGCTYYDEFGNVVDRPGEIIYECFKYFKHDKDTELIYLVGLTKLGLEQETLVIPQRLNNYDVAGLGTSYGFGTNYWYVELGTKLKKLYIPNTIRYIGSFRGFKNFSSELSVFFPGGGQGSIYQYFSIDMVGFRNESYNPQTVYTNKYIFEVTREKDKPYVKQANVSFMYNFFGKPEEDYYWIDNIDSNGKITLIPQEPTRRIFRYIDRYNETQILINLGKHYYDNVDLVEDYDFTGWYKEPECLTLWDFDNDTIPLQEDGNGEYQFIETVLYAGWERVL